MNEDIDALEDNEELEHEFVEEVSRAIAEKTLKRFMKDCVDYVGAPNFSLISNVAKFVLLDMLGNYIYSTRKVYLDSDAHEKLKEFDADMRGTLSTLFYDVISSQKKPH